MLMISRLQQDIDEEMKKKEKEKKAIGVEMVHNRLVGAGALSLATTGAYSPGRKRDQY
jgi:hypothetical protein